MTGIYSYPDVFALGHRAINTIFDTPVVVEEKIDGSQFSMGIIDGELMCRSKGAQVNVEVPNDMFKRAVALAQSLPLHPGWIYRGEWLQKPKHNTLAYDRTPENGLILFDIQTGLEEYMSPAEKHAEADRLGLEFVPVLYEGMVESFDFLKAMMQLRSTLGGCTIEGVVVKNYTMFTHDKKAMIGKYVSERFKEIHEADWKDRNPTQSDILQTLIMRYRTEARWHKAVQHLRDAGTLQGAPQDIGGLIREVPVDVKKECEDEIRDMLFAHFWPKISRGITAGVPEWYKDQLAKGAFDDDQV